MSNVGPSGKADSGQLEERIDLSAEADAKIEQAKALTSSGQLKEALALLAALEKRCRVGNDTPSLVRVCEASLQCCKDAPGDDNIEILITTIQTLATRRSQKTQAALALVKKALPWCLVDSYTPKPVSKEDQPARDRLVVALRDITDGKIFLEGERARLTRALAIIKVRTS